MLSGLPKSLLLSFIILLFSFFSPSLIIAKTMEDDFDDGNIDNWIVVADPDRTPCSAPWEVVGGRVGLSINQLYCTTNLMPNDSLWNDLGNEYVIDVDMEFVIGTDHNIAFRFTPTILKNYWYDIHFTSPG